MPLTVEPNETLQVTELNIDSLEAGESVEVQCLRLDAKGRPTGSIVTITVVRTNRCFYNEGTPFPGISKFHGVAIICSDPKLFESAAPSLETWVGNELVVDQKWQIGAFKRGRAFKVKLITMIHS